MHYPAEKVVFDEDNKPARVKAALRRVHEQLIQHVRQRQQQAQRRWQAASVIQAAERARVAREQERVRHAQERLQRVWAAACIRRAWRLIKARRACLHARRALHAARCIQRLWRGAKARLARMQRALPVLQATLRRQLATPTIKLGARVRLTADALDEPTDYDWSRDALPPDTYGTIVSVGASYSRRYALVESDDARCSDTE